MTRPPDQPASEESTGIHQGWMVLTLNGQSFAVKGSLIEGVYLSSEATTTQLNNPAALIEVHAGRPWFIVPVEEIFSVVHAPAVPNSAVWTVSLRVPSGVAVHVQAIEGPYRGAVMNQTLKTQQGSWPVVEPLPQ